MSLPDLAAMAPGLNTDDVASLLVELCKLKNEAIHRLTAERNKLQKELDELKKAAQQQSGAAPADTPILDWEIDGPPASCSHE